MDDKFRIRMLRTVQFGHTVRPNTFWKGRVYTAQDATNQPDWEKMGKVFVTKWKDRSHPVLLVAGDYEKLA